MMLISLSSNLMSKPIMLWSVTTEAMVHEISGRFLVLRQRLSLLIHHLYSDDTIQ